MTDDARDLSPDAGSPARSTLSRELGDFLIELSIGVHRYAMYPPGHPSLGQSVQGIARRLGPLLDARGQLNIGVARRQLVVEGVATDQNHPVLSELARRLHDLQLGAVSFDVGVSSQEVVELLATLSAEVDPRDVPLGLRPAEAFPRWPHIRVHPLGYERLGIRDAEGAEPVPDRATQLWIGLAQAALAGRDAPAEAQDDPGAIARSIRDHRREAAYDQVIVGYMLQLADELKTEKGAESDRVRRRMAALVREMDEDTLSRLVEMGGDFSARKRFVLDANESLAVDTVLKVLRAAAVTSGQTVSSSMTRLLSKLAVHADQRAGRYKIQAGAALRGNVEKLLDGWELEDPNPDEYTRVLDVIARSAPIFQARRLLEEEKSPADDDIPGPLRVVQTALEVDGWGPTAQSALWDLVGLGYTAQVVGMARECGEGNRAAEEIFRTLTTPAQVRRYLAGSDVDEAALKTLVDRMGPGAVPLVLDALADSGSRSVRRKVFDILRTLGSDVGGEVASRLRGETRWYVIRNWLALLPSFPEAAGAVDPIPYLQNPDPRVRREALPLALDRPGLRDRALALALADPDDRNCRVAVGQLPSPVPDVLLPSLVKRVISADRDEGLRTLAIRSLRGSRSVLAREAVMAEVGGGKSLLGKLRLADPGPAMLAALRVLAADWGDDPAAGDLLAAARRSREASIRAALAGGDE